jgi:gluconate kinase
MILEWDLKNKQTNNKNVYLLSFISKQWKDRDNDLNNSIITDPQKFLYFYKESGKWKTPTDKINLEWMPKLISNETASSHRKKFEETKTKTIELLTMLQDYITGRNKIIETVKFLQFIQKTIETEMTNDNPDIDPKTVIIANTNRKRLRSDQDFTKSLKTLISSQPSVVIEPINQIIEKIENVSISDDQILTKQNEDTINNTKKNIDDRLKWLNDVDSFIKDNSEDKLLPIVTQSTLMFNYFKDEVNNMQSMIKNITEIITGIQSIKSSHENYKHVIFLSNLQTDVIKTLPKVVDYSDKLYLYAVSRTINNIL